MYISTTLVCTISAELKHTEVINYFYKRTDRTFSLKNFFLKFVYQNHPMKLNIKQIPFKNSKKSFIYNLWFLFKKSTI